MPAFDIYLILIGGMSFITFVVWGIDKAAAVTGNWRIPERSLFGLVFLGGAVGGGLGMLVFHHKTRKKIFPVAISLAALFHFILLAIIMTWN